MKTQYKRIPTMSSNMLAMLERIRRYQRRGISASQLDKRTLRALYSRRLIMSIRRDQIVPTVVGLSVVKLAKHFK